MPIRYCLLFFILLGTTSQLLGNIDSLRIQLRLASSDTTKIRLLTEIGDLYQNIPDSALHYYQQGISIANTSRMDHPLILEQKGLLLRYAGIIYRNKGEFYPALYHYQQSLDIYLRLNHQQGISAVYNNFGVVYRNLGNYPLALEHYHKALAFYEEMGDIQGTASCFNNIGVIHDIQGNYYLALEYYGKAYDIFARENNQPRMGSSLINMGNAHLALYEHQQALDHYNRAIDIFIPLNNKTSLARIYQNMSVIYLREKQHEMAHHHLQTALGLAQELNDRKSLTVILKNQAELRYSQGNFEESRRLGLSSLETARQIGSLDDQTNACLILSKAAAGMGHMRQAYDYAMEHIALKDSLHGIEKSKAVMELEAKYQNEKIQQENTLLHKNQELQNLRLKAKDLSLQRQQIIILLAVILLILGLVFLYFKIRQNRKIREAYLQLEVQNREIQAKNKEIRMQRNEINQHRNLVLAQKNQIEEQNKALSLAHREILSGLRYAERIQGSLLPDLDYLNQHLGDSFVLFKPKNMVSGDFYWLARKNGQILIAAADCTGHGVAGGLLSMLGMSFLNESLTRSSLKNSAHYLEYLTQRLEESLDVSEEGRQTLEGMVISFCIYNTKTSSIEYSGADSSLALVRNNKLEHIRGDRHPISQVTSHKNGFSCRLIDLMPGDMIYIYSDGYINQLGGKNGNRYTSARFFRLLENISPHSLSYQKSLLEIELDRWKGNSFEQVDDILLLGFRV